MRASALRLSAAAAALLLAAGARAYDAPGDDFRIAFPSAPVVDATDGGGAVYRVADGAAAYVVRRLPCAEGCAGADESAFFDDFQQRAVASAKGTLQGGRAVTSGAHAGREFVLQAEKPRTHQPYAMALRVFRVGRDVYTASATTPRDPAAQARGLAVLDSFVLLR